MPRPLVFVVALLALLAASPRAAAHDATPAAGESLLAGLGYPEFRITVTDEGAEAPAEVAAGRYLVVLENAAAHPVELEFVLPPRGVTLEQLMATPQPEGQEEGPPDWFYDATIAGGVGAFPGETVRIVLDLAPAGEWFVDVFREREDGEDGATPESAGGTPLAGVGGGPEVLTLTVTGEATPGGEPPAGATVELRDFDFALPAQVPAGRQVWGVTNVGQQPHHVILLRAPVPVTEAQVMELLALEFGMAGEGATPSPGLPNPEEFEEAGFVGVLSAGRSAWVEVDLAPGSCVALCFVPDRETGMPHAAMGMVGVFTVGDGGTATPEAWRAIGTRSCGRGQRCPRPHRVLATHRRGPARLSRPRPHLGQALGNTPAPPSRKRTFLTQPAGRSAPVAGERAAPYQNSYRNQNIDTGSAPRVPRRTPSPPRNSKRRQLRRARIAPFIRSLSVVGLASISAVAPPSPRPPRSARRPPPPAGDRPRPPAPAPRPGGPPRPGRRRPVGRFLPDRRHHRRPFARRPAGREPRPRPVRQPLLEPDDPKPCPAAQAAPPVATAARRGVPGRRSRGAGAGGRTARHGALPPPSRSPRVPAARPARPSPGPRSRGAGSGRPPTAAPAARPALSGPRPHPRPESLDLGP